MPLALIRRSLNKLIALWQRFLGLNAKQIGTLLVSCYALTTIVACLPLAVYEFCGLFPNEKKWALYDVLTGAFAYCLLGLLILLTARLIWITKWLMKPFLALQLLGLLIISPKFYSIFVVLPLLLYFILSGKSMSFG